MSQHPLAGIPCRRRRQDSKPEETEGLHAASCGQHPRKVPEETEGLHGRRGRKDPTHGCVRRHCVHAGMRHGFRAHASFDRVQDRFDRVQPRGMPWASCPRGFRAAAGPVAPSPAAFLVFWKDKMLQIFSRALKGGASQVAEGLWQKGLQEGQWPRILSERLARVGKTAATPTKAPGQLILFIAYEKPVGAVKAPKLRHSKWGEDRGGDDAIACAPLPSPTGSARTNRALKGGRVSSRIVSAVGGLKAGPSSPGGSCGRGDAGQDEMGVRYQGSNPAGGTGTNSTTRVLQRTRF